MRYEATEGGWVAVAEDTEPPVASYGRTLEKARENIAAVLAEAHGTRRGSVVIDDELSVPRKVQDRVEAARSAKDAALKANALSAECTLEAINALDGEGLSLRDIAYLLGLSHGRVHQILQQHNGETR